MVSRKVAHQLAEWITNGKVAVGMFLPPTRELASHFNTSQHTVGAALRELEYLQLVECLPRQGAKVTARRPAASRGVQLKQIGVFVVDGKDWLLAPHQTADWGWRIAQAMERELFADGFTLTSLPASHPADDLAIGLEERMDRLGGTLCGVLCFNHVTIATLIEQLNRRDLPWVSINRPSRRIDYNYISANHHQAGWKVGRLFAASGFGRALLLASDAACFASDAQKIAGVFQGYVESGVSTEGLRTVSCGNYFEMDGYRAVRETLEEGYRPQAIFATGDLLAGGAMHALKDAGLHVPEDVSVIGATGLEASAGYDPPLSAVAQPMEEMGQAAGKMLREMIAEGTRRHAPRYFDCPLILRSSTSVSEAIRQTLAKDPDGNPLSETAA